MYKLPKDLQKKILKILVIKILAVITIFYLWFSPSDRIKVTEDKLEEVYFLKNHKH